VQLLGSAKYAEREAAARALSSREDVRNVIGQLRLAVIGGNTEAACRAKTILDDFARRKQERFLQYGRQGRIDVLVEWANLPDEQVDAAAFRRCMVDIGWEIVRRSQESVVDAWDGSNLLKHPFQGPANMAPPTDKYDFIRQKGWLTGERVSGKLIAAKDQVRVQAIDASILFSNDKVSAYNGAYYFIIVCDDNVSLSTAHDCIIISRTNINLDKMYQKDKSLLLAGHNVRLDFFNGERVLDPPSAPPRGSDIKQRVRRPLEFVRFFQLEDIGLEASRYLDPSRTFSGIKVEKLSGDSPLAKAGIQVGDVITEVHGFAAGSIEDSRKSFRRDFASGETKVTVRRDGKPLELRVFFYGFELPGERQGR
jgi:hypothetical protein